MADSASAINLEIIKLWKERFNEQDRISWPLICPEPVIGGLAVVGCNPALPTGGYYSVPQWRPDETAGHVASLLNEEEQARRYYPYYAPFHKFARELGLVWEHIDLFFYRETNQEKVKSLVMDERGKLNNFGVSQIGLAIRLLRLTQPKIILVANAFAGHILKKYLEIGPIDEDGLYWFKREEGKTPMFFSSMMSGVRPFDSHSRERLLWQMKKTLKDSESVNPR